MEDVGAHLPHGKPGKPRVDDRTVISGILHVLKSATFRQPWATDDYLQSLQSLLPAPYLAAHFRENGGRRSQFQTSFPSPASHVKAHRLWRASKRGSSRKRLCRSRGGRTSKIHAFGRLPRPSRLDDCHGEAQGRRATLTYG